MFFHCLCCPAPSEIHKIQDECLVCLEKDDREHYLQPCGHHVHEKCLLGWLISHPAPYCPLCQSPIQGFWVDHVYHPFYSWKQKALYQRCQERFMNGCFVYVFCHQKIHRWYLLPVSSLYDWKRVVGQYVNLLFQEGKLTYSVYDALQDHIQKMNVLELVEGRRYRVVGEQVGIMFSKSTCVMGSS